MNSVRITALILSVLSVLLALAVLARSATTSKNTTCWIPEGCVTQYQENPYTYKVGAVVDMEPVDTQKARGISIRLQPLGTYSLFTEQILICDRPIDLFNDKQNPLVLTYETRAHRTLDGIGCHRLVRVDNLSEEKLQ